MNIFYYSVHQILEDDEVRLFQSLDHNVFCLGANSRDGAAQNFRPAIKFSAIEASFYDDFDRLGGKYTFANLASVVLPPSFVDRFDVFIIMHDPGFIIKFWNLIRSKAVVWRTIGQGVDAFEDILRPYREAGLSIVRYSPVELEISNSIGQEAVIRFYKDPESYRDWNGNTASVLTFSNSFKARYPTDFADYQQIVCDFNSVLGGIGNEASENGVGLVDSATQNQMLRDMRGYLYASGLYIPYTLNFMEAWMTGCPMIVYAPFDRRDRFFEIDQLIEDGVTGFVCRDIGSARERIRALLADHRLAARIGEAGRRAAVANFGRNKIRAQWQKFLEQAQARQNNSAVDASPTPKDSTPVKSMSLDIFDVLTLLRPYDIDLGKIRFGNPRDGGYVLADLPSRSDVVSFGVGPDVTFELEMAERGRRVFLHDHTVDRTPVDHPRFSFSRKGICGIGNETVDLMTLDKHMEKAGVDGSALILKMDVEGHEWDVFSTVDLDTLDRFEQITLEIHWLENLVDPLFRSRVARSISQINTLFTLFHVHANNCAELHIVDGFVVASVIELSYVKSDLVRRSASTKIYPSPLDKANHPFFHDHALLFYPFMPTSADSASIRAVVSRVDMEKRLSSPS